MSSCKECGQLAAEPHELCDACRHCLCCLVRPRAVFFGALLCQACIEHCSRVPNGPCGAPRRLPYEKPRVVSEDCFETLALSCALSNPFVCPGGAPDRS